MELLLASASPSRKRLLEQACIPHRVQVSGIDEEAIQHADPLQLVQDLAIAKAKAVAHAISIEGISAGLGILACDSMFEFDGEVFGKPKDPADAISRWQRMAGGWGGVAYGPLLAGS